MLVLTYNMHRNFHEIMKSWWNPGGETTLGRSIRPPVRTPTGRISLTHSESALIFFLLTTTPFTQPQDFVCLLYQWPSRQEIPGQVRRRQMISHLLLSCITHVGEGDGCINYLRSNPTQRLFEITHTSLSDEDCEVLFRWLTTGGGVSSQQGVSLCLRTQRINFTSSP